MGVDEGDIVKNDGKYAYIISKDKKTVIIADVYPAENVRILSSVKMNGTIREIYIYSDKMVVLGYEYSQGSMIYVFNIENRENPILSDTYHCKGSITQTRMIGDYLYIIGQQYVDRQITEEDLPVHPSQIYYFSNFNYSSSYYSLPITLLMSVNVLDNSIEPVSRAILMERSQNIFVSVGNIYITYTKNNYGGYYYSSSSSNSVIHRISIDSGSIQYEAMGEVTGTILNRFSMGEHQGYFRIATTSGHVSRNGASSATNQVYILDMDLKIVGSVLNIAPGERIYSTRFMGNRAYLVTFKKVDPFFVIDLTDPYKPKILGELKIPGYSDYLHPYDENHVIGLGKETVEAETGNFAWYQGVKLSLFDVTDVQNPKELSKYIIGDRGTYSPALNDPHAFLFSREKNLLALPIVLAEIDETKYPDGAPANTRGDFTWSGAYVFDISEEKGFGLKGRISHEDGDQVQSSCWYGSSDTAIKRSFYIDSVLYTCSGNKVKMNDLVDLNDINTLLLPSDTK
jgi:uncharacterized secreted protein with C-terminal beta-propeller domain